MACSAARNGHPSRPLNRIVRGLLATMRNVVMGLAVLTASTPALAQHGAGMGLVVALLAGFYVVLCLFSVPVSLLLHGSITKRIVVGLTAPVVGMALGFGAVEISA